MPQLLTVTISTQLPWAVGQQGVVQAAHGGRHGLGCCLPACRLACLPAGLPACLQTTALLSLSAAFSWSAGFASLLLIKCDENTGNTCLLPPADYHATSRSCPMRKLSAAAIAEDATALVKRWAAEQAAGWSISALFITAGNFVAVPSAAAAITRFFKPASAAAEGAAEAAEAEAGQQAEACEEHAQGQQQHEQQDAAGAGGLGQQQEQEERQQEQQRQQLGPTEAAGPSGSAMPGSGEQQTAQTTESTALPSSSRVQQPQQFEGQPVDESVLAELPPELQKEIRAQMKLQQMAARMEQRKPGTSGGGGGSKRPASGGSTAPTGTQRIDAFLKGKRPRPKR